MLNLPNYRPPPPQLANTELNQVSSWCRYDPVACCIQVGIETVFMLLAFCSLLFLTGGAVPQPLDIAKFLITFSTLSVAARMISDDLGNKISVSAIAGVGSKVMSMLAPRFVGW